ncbi:MAG TPA: PTS system mannose/fructose/sorbose family transporter subunit IID, partial [Gemmatimonadaceae bacterium]|nr:PTS system mannose/fructose/sorbose family transporter subunit IID [Gemmatimonadaceae bacterium]
MTEPTRVPRKTWLAMFARLLAVQGSWNYELLMGNGIAFAAEPGLRLLPETEYREALAREGRYFNCHPYLASVAVGSLVRAELEHVPGPKIERFRTALCGPLGSVGDRLIWAGWL